MFHRVLVMPQEGERRRRVRSLLSACALHGAVIGALAFASMIAVEAIQDPNNPNFDLVFFDVPKPPEIQKLTRPKPKLEPPELQAPAPEPPKPVIVQVKVRDINEAYQLLSSRNVQFEAKPHLVARLESSDLWMAFCRDSEGNLLSIMSEQRHS